MPRQAIEWEQRTYFSDMARELLHVLDPRHVAVNASRYGVVIYPRTDYDTKPTPWEFLQLQENQPLPADWIGFLLALMPQPQLCNGNSSGTLDRSARPSVPGLRSFLVQDDAFTKTRRFARNLESRSDGQNQEPEGTTTEE